MMAEALVCDSPGFQIGSSAHFIHFRNESHDSTLLREMKKLYDEDVLKDVTICAGDLEFSCHKNVLAATSPYFKLMFTIGLAECKKDRIDIFEVDPKSLKEIIEYAYTGRLKISRSNAQNLLGAASLFQILPVQRACAKFMESQLDINNCIGIHYFAQIHSCQDLKFKAREFIEKNFAEVCKSEEFMSLDFTQIADIILSDELNVEREEVILGSVLTWVDHDPEDRKEFFCELLPLVRLGLIKSKYLAKLLQHKLVRDCSKCTKYINDFEQYESNPCKYEGDYDFSLSLRSGMYVPENCMILVGGVNQATIRPCINCYNPISEECFFLDDFPESRKLDMYDCEDLACVVTEDNLLFAGGGNYIYHHMFEDSEDESFEDLEYKEYVVQKDFYQFDNDHNEWVIKAPMLFPKSNFTLASLNGKIFCFGGLTENKHPTEIIEVYDVEKNRWNYQGMLPTTLVDLGSVVYDGHIYLLGGRTGVGAHNSLIRYNPETEEWTSLAGMLTPRFNFGACVLEDEIYVAGGQIYSHCSYTITREVLRTVEIYNVESNTWRLGPELPLELYNVCLAMISGSLYACGTPEFNEQSQMRYNVVCRLDLGAGQWEIVEDSLCNIKGFRCVVAKLQTRKLQKVFSPSTV